MASSSKNLKKSQASNLRAVVDIGSNSVRLVIYEGPSRAPIAICNEKALCGLGRDMTSDGRLNPNAVSDAVVTLSRFRRILDEFGSPPVYAIATAAVRDAKDGNKFVDAISALGFDVNVISGVEEAKLAALGVVSFEPGATGLVGDMGGGSLELIGLSNGVIDRSESLPVGPFNIMRAAGDDMKAAATIIEKELDGTKFLAKENFQTLYAVGGAWRAVARIHMRLRSYPLSVLHHYQMTSREAVEICDLVSRQSRRSLEEIPGIPRRRLDTLPYAALVMRSVIERSAANNVIVSSGGVREGLLYQDLSKSERDEDPLLAVCRFFANRLSPNPDYGEVVAGVIAPLFPDDDAAERRLRNATCQLVDIGAFFHPDLRASQAFEAALSAPFVGVSHEERIGMAVALFRRHEGRNPNLPGEQAIGLLSWDAQQKALKLGLALRFVAAFAPKLSAPLKNCRLEYAPGQLVFRAPENRQPLMGETPRKRFLALAAAFDAEPLEIYED